MPCNPHPATGAIHDIIRGRAESFGSSGAINISGLTTEGNGLFTYEGGQLLYVTLDGKVKSIARDVTQLNFRPSYDPTRPQTAESVEIVARFRESTAVSGSF